MLTARAVVRRRAADGFVDLEVDGSARCAGCAGVCLWRRLESTRLARVPIDGPIAPGDTVLLSLPGRAVVFGSLTLHGLPLASLLAGALTGSLLLGSDWGALAGAVLAVSAVFALTPLLRRRLELSTMASLRVMRTGERRQ